MRTGGPTAATSGDRRTSGRAGCRRRRQSTPTVAGRAASTPWLRAVACGTRGVNEAGMRTAVLFVATLSLAACVAEDPSEVSQEVAGTPDELALLRFLAD